MKNTKALWIKVGWSEYYQGGEVNGDYGYIKDEKGNRNDRAAHEKYNFLPNRNGKYQIYVPPNGKNQSLPFRDDSKAWTVFCLSKNGKNGVQLVGWFENCKLLEENKSRSEYSSKEGFPLDQDGGDFIYSITSSEAYLIRPEYRQRIKHPSLTRSFMYLTGPDIDKEKKRTDILKTLKKFTQSTHADHLIKNPTIKKIHALPSVSENPFTYSTDAKHRKKVETKAVDFTTKYYEDKKYNVESHESKNCGYDLLATRGKSILEIEVKGTASKEEQFFISRNELNRMNNSSRWKLAIVTEALSDNRKLEIYSPKEVKKKFNLNPMIYRGKLK